MIDKEMCAAAQEQACQTPERSLAAFEAMVKAVVAKVWREPVPASEATDLDRLIAGRV